MTPHKLHALFPTAVMEFALGRDLSAEELTFLTSQEQTANIGNTTSVNRNILDAPAVQTIREFIDRAVYTYLESVVCPSTDVKLRITQSWTNHSAPGQFHHRHAHPNSYLSGCFYVRAAEGEDRIHFFNDTYERIQIEPKSFNLFNSTSWWLPVSTGALLLFPSNLTHMVETVTAQDTRVSLAFNTFPVGDVGSDMNLTGLKLT